MRISQKVLKRRFKRFNEKYFKGELVTPKFIIGGSKDTAGAFESNIFMLPDENGEYYIDTLNKITIHLSKKLIKDSKVLDDILLHEMIHYYGYYSNEDMNGEHEDFFMSYAERINEDGYNVDAYYYV